MARTGACSGGRSVSPGKRSFALQKRPVAVWIVAAAFMPTIPIDLCFNNLNGCRNSELLRRLLRPETCAAPRKRGRGMGLVS